MSDLSRKKEVDWRLLVSCVVFALMVYVRDLGLFAFNPIHFTAIVILISLWLPYQKLTAFFFFYISVGIGVHGAAWIPLVLILMLKARKFNALQFVFAIVILLIEIIHLATYSFDVDLIKYVLYAVDIIVFFFMLFDDTTDEGSLKNNIKYYINGVVAAALIVIAHSISGFGFNEVFLESMRIGSDFNQDEINAGMQTTFNSNQLAYFSITAFTLALFVKKIYKHNLVKVLMMLVLVLAGVLTASRTWIIVMALVLALFFLFNNVKGRLVFVLVAVALLLLAGRYITYSEAFEERFATRFKESSFETAGHRTEIFADYNRWLAAHPERIIYGTGAIYYGKVCQIQYSMHNGTQQILVCYGVIGLLLFAICAYAFYRRFSKKSKIKFSNYIPFLICFIFLQSGQFLSPPIMMLPCIASVLPLKLYYDDVEQNK